MNLGQILRELKELGVYNKKEWKEYLGYFNEDDVDSLSTKNEEDNIVRRIIGDAKVDSGNYPVMKVVNYEQIKKHKQDEDFTLGIVSGCYDLLHLGHIRSMVYAKKYLSKFKNPRLAILTLRDEFIKTKKGEIRPVLKLRERMEMISKLKEVDYIIPLEESNCLSALWAMKPDYFFKSKADLSQDIVRREIELVESYGGKIVYFSSGNTKNENKRTITTSSLIKSIEEKINGQK